jgi:hypothetical protein
MTPSTFLQLSWRHHALGGHSGLQSILNADGAQLLWCLAGLPASFIAAERQRRWYCKSGCRERMH